jgi:hypothetical protein
VKKNPVAKDLRTPKYRQRKVESKKKYNRKEVVGYYYDGYNDKSETLYKENPVTDLRPKLQTKVESKKDII